MSSCGELLAHQKTVRLFMGRVEGFNFKWLRGCVAAWLRGCVRQNEGWV